MSGRSSKRPRLSGEDKYMPPEPPKRARLSEERTADVEHAPRSFGMPSVALIDETEQPIQQAVKRGNSTHVVRFMQEVRFSAKPATVIPYETGTTHEPSPTRSPEAIETSTLPIQEAHRRDTSRQPTPVPPTAGLNDRNGPEEGWGGAGYSTLSLQRSALPKAQGLDAEEQAIAAEAEELVANRRIARTRSPQVVPRAESDTEHRSKADSALHGRRKSREFDRYSEASYADDEASDGGSSKASANVPDFRSISSFSMAKTVSKGITPTNASAAYRGADHRAEGEPSSPDVGFLTDAVQGSRLRSVSSFRWTEDESDSGLGKRVDTPASQSPVSQGVWVKPAASASKPKRNNNNTAANNKAPTTKPRSIGPLTADAPASPPPFPFDANAFREYKQRLQVCLHLLRHQLRQATQHKEWCEQAKAYAQLEPKRFAGALNRTAAAIRLTQRQLFVASADAARNANALALPPLAQRLSHLATFTQEPQATQGQQQQTAPHPLFDAPFLCLPYRLHVPSPPEMPASVSAVAAHMAKTTKSKPKR